MDTPAPSAGDPTGGSAHPQHRPGGDDVAAVNGLAPPRGGRGAGQGKGGGPKTPEGKARSSRNATKHGIYSPNPAAGGEAPEDYEVLLEGLRRHFEPTDLYAEELVAKVADELWTLRRISRATSALIDLQHDGVDPVRPSLLKPIVVETFNFSAFKTPVAAMWDLLRIDSLPDDHQLDDEVVADLTLAVNRVSSSVPAPAGWKPAGVRAGDVRQMLSAMAAANGWPRAEGVRRVFDHLVDVLGATVRAEERATEALQKKGERSMRKARAHLPEIETFERLLVAKRSSERSLALYLGLLALAQGGELGSAKPLRLR